MSARIFLSHSVSKHEFAGRIAALLEAMIAGAEVGTSSLPAHEPAGGEDSFAALKQQITDCDVAIALITEGALGSSQVPFQIGAVWALGKRLVLLFDPDGSDTELYLPMGHAEALVLGPQALLELSASIAAATGLRSEMSQPAREALAQLFPDWQGLDRESSERPITLEQRDSGTTQQQWPVEGAASSDEAAVRPATALMPRAVNADWPRRDLPSCMTSLLAGRAVSDCVFHREEGGSFADELDLPFGAFLAALGGNWSVLRDLEDLDVWREATENVFGALAPAEQYVRCWYEVGFQLATLLNLAGRDLDGSPQQDRELEALGQSAWSAFCDAAQGAAVEPDELEQLSSMLSNLRGPQQGRDYANLGRIQERIRELASRSDATGMVASA